MTTGTTSGGTARLIVDGKEYELPVVTSSEGERAIDVSALRAKTGLITLDSGYGNTGACESAITYIDGDRGILRYRGYPVEQLAEQASFVETAHLLLYGELPSATELAQFSKLLNRSSLIHEDLRHFFVGFPPHAHPMAILSSIVGSFSAFDPLPTELNEERERQLLANLISQVRTIAAFSYKMSIGEPLVYPSFRLRYVENFLNMMFASPVNDYHPDPDIVRAIELFLILHADHEQNCSTSSVRMVGSSLANAYSVISAGVCALWGPRHGGANQEVIQMLMRIHQGGGDGTEYVQAAKRKDSKERLMGFGHRVYKTHDPRARILKEYCHKLLSKPGMSDPLFDIALRLEDIATHDPYFQERNLYPNVDFYSGLILRAAGIPVEMFTVLFTIGRVPGWLAHWREMSHAPGFRIARPRQLYTGQTMRDFVPIDQR
jgi:citrate synthase